MEFKQEQFKGKGIFLVIPMYTALCNGYCMNSCMYLQRMCTELSIPFQQYFILGESLVQRARNYLVAEFLKSSEEYTHLLCIDADIEFNPADVLQMLLLEKEVIGAPYPLKFINWEKIKQSVIENPEITPEALCHMGSQYVFNLAKDQKEIQLFEPVEVQEIGTGYVLIERGVFKKLDEHYPELQYIPDHKIYFDGKETIGAYFDCCIDKETKRYLSEDFYFNKIWRDMGGTVWCCPWMKANHHGTIAYRGDIPLIAQNKGNL